MGTFGNTFGSSLGGQQSSLNSFDDIAPTNLIVSRMKDSEIDFQWTINSLNKDGSRVYISTDGVTYTEKGTSVTNTYNATGLTAGALYYFKVVNYKGSRESASTNIYDTRFKITVDTTKSGSASNTFILQTNPTGTFNYYVDWGEEGSEDHVTVNTSQTHVYTSSGVYQIKIRGVFPNLMYSTGDKAKITKIDNWGNIQWASMNAMFYGCLNMVANYIDLPNTIHVTDMKDTFRECALFDGKVDYFVHSGITIIGAMFSGCKIFNQSLLTWDTSGCTSIDTTFRDCWLFNQPVSHFVTAQMTSFRQAFEGCYVFNQNVNTFNTANVILMHKCFSGASAFNQPISNWNTANVTDMSYMFNACSVFNQSVSNFNTAKVTLMQQMFAGCRAFNQSVSNFNTSLVTNMANMFDGCYVFNQSVSSFDTSKVTLMTSMFSDCRVFNQSISNFDTHLVTLMNAMFMKAYVFNQSVASFDTSACTNMSYMFYEARNFNQSVATFNIANITTAAAMFQSGNALSTANYDAILIAWAAQTSHTGVPFHAGTAKYSAGTAATARGVLTGTYTWTITDGGQL